MSRATPSALLSVAVELALIKGGMEAYGVTTNPVFFPGDVEPRYKRVPDVRRPVDGDRDDL